MKRTVRILVLSIGLAAAGACKSAPPEAGALADSGIAAVRRGDSATALQRYDEAIKLNPNYARAYRLRGDILRNRGDIDGAIAAYDQAINHKADDAGVFYDRAYVYQMKGDYDRAIQDFDRAIALKSNHALALKNRGRTHFYMGHFAEAAADLRRGAQIDSTNAYVAIWLYMATKRLGKDNAKEFAAQLAHADSVHWPAPVARFYQGRMTAEQLMASASNTDSKAQSDQRCAAAFYIGEAALWSKQPAEAARRFQETVSTCPKSFTEYDAARAELRRLGKPA